MCLRNNQDVYRLLVETYMDIYSVLFVIDDFE